MHLKSLTLRGFKTFADKTSLVFDPSPSITAIVGPNGCGKSNLVDALRFVLGEQSIKELRGSSLQEVIFAGSASRKAISLGEVSMLIDNSDSRLKADYGEILIKRRVFRSGESEFYINKNLCRLRDIKDLFLDTGIGNGAYSIVNQGQVDSILSSKPEDRRAVFEEAASIGKYKFRKRAAERRLIGTEQNLLRVNDLRNEIKENLSLLESQAAKAGEYKEIKEKLKALEIGLSKKQARLLAEKKESLASKIESMKNKIQEAEAGVLAEEERTKLKNSLKIMEETIECSRKQIESVKACFEETNNSIYVRKERLSQLTERSEQIQKEREHFEALRAAKSEKMGEKAAALEDYKNSHKASQQYLEDANHGLEEIRRHVEESIAGWNSLKNPIFEREMEISSKKHTIAETRLSRRFAQETFSKDKLFLDNLKGLKEDISLLESEVFALEGVSRELKDRLSMRKSAIYQKIDIETGVLEKNIETRKAEIENIEKKLAEEEQALSLTESDAHKMSEQFGQLEQKMKDLTAEKEKAIERLAKIRAAFSSFDEILKQKHEEQGAIQEELHQTEATLAGKTHETRSLSERINATRKEIEDAEAALSSLTAKEGLLMQSLNALLEKRSREQAELEIFEEKIRSISNEDKYVRDALSKEEISFAKTQGELNIIEALMRQEYQISLDDMSLCGTPEISNSLKAREEIDCFKSAIRDMGPVNLLAVEEFEAAKERLSFIETQYSDLINARENLNSIIRNLDNEARQRFLETISNVNRYFTEIFASLFEGGEAKITLAEGDILEAGIDIMARPSGKKWINLSLMSGGENALTAISILFALMKTNPSPFCFMDEVDAALDEINTMRFARLLKDFSASTQIIVITHSKRTMSIANSLYGITMEEPGVSRVVSMKLVKVAD